MASFRRRRHRRGRGALRRHGRRTATCLFWLAQQAAEKALKGALVHEGINFPFRHDLDALRTLLPDGWRVKTEHPDLAELTEWAVEARYPGDWPEATVDEAKRAATQGRAVVESVRADLTSRSPAQ